jgi:molybdenum cofactor synthesis domain-containing protein
MTGQMTARRRAGVVIASTRAAAGVYQDECGPLIRDWLRGQGFTAGQPTVVPDGAAVGRALRAMLEARPAVIITSGGTGLSADDRTPEETAPLLDRELPGLMEALRRAGAASTPMAALSRGHAGTAGGTFILNLPGSPGGVRDGLAVLEPLLGHICSQLEGHHDH